MKLIGKIFNNFKVNILFQASSLAGLILGAFNLYQNIDQQNLIDDNSDMIRMLKERVSTLEGNPVVDSGKVFCFNFNYQIFMKNTYSL